MTDIHDMVEKDSRYSGSCNCEIDDACNVILLDLVDQARKEERQKVLELIDKYFRTKGFNSTDKGADSFAQFVVEVIREELRQQIKEMR